MFQIETTIIKFISCEIISYFYLEYLAVVLECMVIQHVFWMSVKQADVSFFLNHEYYIKFHIFRFQVQCIFCLNIRLCVTNISPQLTLKMTLKCPVFAILKVCTPRRYIEWPNNPLSVLMFLLGSFESFQISTNQSSCGWQGSESVEWWRWFSCWRCFWCSWLGWRWFRWWLWTTYLYK